MILEDFFTLTEMKDGLTTFARVDELISIMREQKIGATNNLGDALRQWSTVASVLAVTENKDCLNHFVHLDGLFFLSEWLQEARKQSSDTTDGSADTFVCLLLGLLLRLPIKEDSHISRVEIAVRQFLNHNNQNIVDRASKLLNCLVVEGGDSVKSDVEMKCDPCVDEGMKGDSRMIEMKPSQLDHDASSSKDVNCETSSGPESAIKGALRQDDKACKADEDENFLKEKCSISNEHTPTGISSSDEAAGCAISGDLSSLPSSSALDRCEENASVVHDSSVSLTTGMISNGTGKAPSLCGVNAHEDHEMSKETASDGVREMEKEPMSCVSSRSEALVVPASSGLSSSSPCARECVGKLVQVQNLDSKDCGAKESAEVHNTSCTECELSTTENCDAQKNSDTIEYGLPRNLSKTEELKSAAHDLSGPFSQDSINHCSGKDASANTNGVEVNGKSHLKVRRRARLKKKSHLFKEKLTSTASVYGNMRSETGLEYGDDALEFAVQVAIEAKLEVADREQCSSSHEGSSEDNTMESDSQYSHEEKHGQLNLHNAAAKTDSSDDSNKNSSRRLKCFDNNGSDQVQELESTEVTSVIQEPVGRVEKTRCNFDLNADFSNDDADYLPTPVANHQNNLSMPVAVVAAPNGSPALAIGARIFEGEQGWKGSAPTSAFSPASPRRIPDGEKLLPTNNKFNLFKIDLNISEGDNDIPVDQAVEKQTPDLSELPSGEYSGEFISRKTRRLNLDLNRLGDDETFPNTPSHWRHQHHNDNCSSSPACSSSARQTAMRDFDLNDNPLLLDTCSHDNQLKSSFKHENPYGMRKPDDPVITLLGSRMTVAPKKPEHFFQAHQPFLANGLSMEPPLGVARPSPAYSNMPTTGYGHNELTLRPPTFSPSPAFHSPGFFPYMVDSRGSTSIPVFGSSTGMHDPSAYGSSFLVSVPGVPPGLNSVGCFRPGFDLNSGAIFMENGSKEMGSFRQPSVQGQGSIREEQIRTASQSASGSNLPIKRKEPECEPSYPFGYKQVTSWH